MNNPYIKNISIAMQEKMTYTTAFLIQLMTGFLFNYASVAIWYAIMQASKNHVDKEMIQSTIRYMILAASASTMYYSIANSEVTNRIRTGAIGRDLLYPVSLPVSIFSKSLGESLVVVATTVIPGILLLTLLFHPMWHFTVGQFCGLICGGLLGYYLYFLINFLTDLIGFWWFETFYFHYIKDALVNFLSGALVPLWFYPSWLYKSIEWLPFKNIIYTPVAFSLGKISTEQFLLHTLQLVGWLVMLTLFAYWVWRKGTKKVVIQGG